MEYGSFCLTDIDECSQLACVNGTCVNTLGSYLCNCTDTGFHGTYCEKGLNKTKLRFVTHYE